LVLAISWFLQNLHQELFLMTTPTVFEVQHAPLQLEYKTGHYTQRYLNFARYLEHFLTCMSEAITTRSFEHCPWSKGISTGIALLTML